MRRGGFGILATTNHVSADLAVMPFLWVVPLALYLVTFIIAFDRPGWYRPTLIAALTLAAIYGAALLKKNGFGSVKTLECATAGWLYSVIADAATLGVADAVRPEPRSFYVGPLKFLTINF